jgi:prepilin-type N-terminal cleavage/methylation domain-containing protein
MNKTKNKQSGFTLIELLTVITIIGILFGLAFKGGETAMTAAAKAEATNNMRNILQAYVAYHNENGGITEDLEGEEMIDTSGDQASMSGSGTNHTWVGVLAQFENSMNDANLYMLKRDKTGNKENKKHKAQVVLDPTDEERKTLDEKFEESILCFNMFAGLEESEAFGAGKTPVLYTAGLQEDGTWSKKGPHGKAGGHIGFLDNSVKGFKKIGKEDFYKFDDPEQETQKLSEAIFGIALGHSGEDSFDGERE